MRFIPAHAGNILGPSNPIPYGAVHPRARGEHVDLTALALVWAGSSPRTRGTSRPSPKRQGARRFIPAHAGNMAPITVLMIRFAVHPRARGEHHQSGPRFRRRGGSSPRTRGTWPPWAIHGVRGRFIPAHAGNMEISLVLQSLPSVHPRARGEHFSIHDSISENFGSSPRTRGTWPWCGVRACRTRFIPAHAGNIARRSR